MFWSAPDFSAHIFYSNTLIRVAQEPRLHQTFHGDTKIHEDEFVHPFGKVRAPLKPNFGNEVFAESFLIGHWIHSVKDADKVFEKYLRGVRECRRHLLENIKREEMQAPFYHI